MALLPSIKPGQLLGFVVACLLVLLAPQYLPGVHGLDQVEIDALNELISTSIAPSRWDGVNVSDVCNSSLTGGGMNAEIICTAGHITQLRSVGQWTGEFSCALFDLPYVQYLQFSDNDLFGFRGRVDKCTNICRTSTTLINLNLGSNKLTGQLPDLSYCVNLQEIYLSKNFFNGSIPANYISTMPSLMLLRIAQNDLTGGLPSSLFNSTTLLAIDACENGITGSLPQSLTSSGLTELCLGRNAMSGPIPPWFWQTNWQSFSLAHNKFDCPANTTILDFLARSESFGFTDAMYEIHGLPDCNPELPSQRRIQLLPLLLTATHHLAEPDVTIFNDRVHIELINQTKFHLFAIDQTTRQPFREEYCIFEIFGVQWALSRGVSGTTGLSTRLAEFAIEKFANITYLDAEKKRVQFIAILSNGAIFTLEFDLSRADTGVKFSFSLRNFPNNWELYYVMVPLRWTIKSPQSDDRTHFSFNEGQGEFGVVGYSNFTTSIFTALLSYGELANGQPGTTLRSRSRKMETYFGFSDTYYRDGVANDKSIRYHSTQFYSFPFGPAILLEDFVQAQGPFPYDPAEQSYSFLTSMMFRGANDTFIYDPDISLTTLFTSSEPTTPEQALAAGAIAGIAIAGAVVVAGISGLLVFRKRIFPNRRSESKLTAAPANAEPAASSRPSSKWQSSKSTQLTNLQ